MSAPTTIELAVNGMTCGNCARRVTDALQAVPGVHSVSVNLEARRASVRWTGTETGETATLVSALKAAGYDAKLIMPGSAAESEVHHMHWHANFWLGGIVTATLMFGEWALALGMTPWFRWLGLALGGAVQVFAGAQFYRGAWQQLKQGRSNMDTLVALGSTTAFGYSSWALFSGYGGHVYFMEAAAIITLISIGHWLEARITTRASATLRSLLQLAPATARKLQTAANPASSGARFNRLDIRNFKPKAGAPTVEREVPVAELRPGDFVALRPGDRVPVDGVVTEGDSSVDESMLTGESVPVDKQPGREVYAGTVNVNGRLVMRVTATGEATALASIIAAVQRAQSSRANIQRIGDRVSSVFVPVVVVLALTAGLWWGLAPESARQTHNALSPFLWPAHPPVGVAAGFIIAAAVLIIACPCAMGLATPAAIMASANVAARRGILIRDGVALEKAGRITTVVFDKTGTLTVGKPEVVAMGTPGNDPNRFNTTPIGAGAETGATNRSRGRQSAPSKPLRPTVEAPEKFAPTDVGNYVGDEVCRLTAALARHSTHPISQALATLATMNVTVSEWTEIRGAGVQGRIMAEHGEWKLARLGSWKWLRESGVNVAEGEVFAEEWAGRGATIVGLALDQALAALFAVRDTLKPGAKDVVEQLTRSGLRVHLLTGDNARTAAGIAQEVGIAAERVTAEVRPEQKAELVKQLQTRGERVAFVGDGINDAPALKQAELGIAVSKASDVARDAADVILLHSEIEAVPEALGLARATLRTIKQNLFWAFFYNAVGVPLAALGFMSPVLCAAAMGLSDLIVIGNALRLARWRR